MAALLGAGFLLLPPGGAGARAAEAGFRRDLAQAVLASAYEAILLRHLEAASPGELGLWMLRGLEVIDPALKVELRAETLLVSRAGRVLGARPVPPPGQGGGPGVAAAGALAVAIAALFDAASRVSPALREAGAERMLRSGFEELFNHLDPYSRYLTPEEARAARARLLGQSALGLRLATIGGAGADGGRSRVTIAGIQPGSVAEQAGLLAGDRLLAVDGFPVTGGDLRGAAALLEGPAGTEVTLTVQRRRRRLEVVLPRLLAAPETVRAERQHDIIWLRLEGFANDTDLRLAAQLRAELSGQDTPPPPPRGIVLDLRGNRGGLLGQAVAVASTFLQGGLVARTAGRHPDATRLYLADAADLAGSLPVVVLVDGRTASAAEIVAASLSGRGRAVVVGSATQGKGLIQIVVPLPDGGELLVTWGQVLAPLGWPIQGLGVLPEVCTSLGAEATDATLARLAAREPSPMAPVLARLRAARAPVPAEEVTALRNACPPAEGRETDLAVARALLETPIAYGAAVAR